MADEISKAEKFGMIANSITNGISSIGLPILGMALQGYNDRRQLRQQGKLNEQQLDLQKRMANYNQDLALDMWEKTNYDAQREQMEKAGLNVGLMYKGAGQGGVTMQPNSSINAPQAPKGGQEIGMAMQLGLQMQQTQANIELMKANAEKAKAEAIKIAGVDTEATKTGITEANTRINKIIAETTNEGIKGKLMNIQSDIAEIDKANRDYQIKSEIENTLQNANKLKLENAITTDTYNDIVNSVHSTAIGKMLENDLTQAKTSLTNTEIQQIKTQLVQKWSELSLQTSQLDQNERRLQFEMKLKTFEAEINAEFPNASQTLGSILKKAYDNLEAITYKYRGEPNQDRLPK